MSPKTHSEELLYRIAIMQIPQVGAVTARHLISYCGSAKAVFESRKKMLLRIPGIGPAIADSILGQQVLKDAEAEMEFNEQQGIRAIFHTDADYPKRLQTCHDAPLILFYKGNANLNHFRIIGIVGTRTPTPQGMAFCESLIAGLQPFGPLIVSGLAYGIDITAHRSALNAGLDTIGVLGHGLRRLYPAAHQSTARKMIQQGGLLTEFHSQTRPDREHFPMRNRIIAGICDALVVVETAQRGGSVITADLANQYNKDVFAVPGRPGDPYSLGCNHLIKVHKAALIEHAGDIAYLMRWEIPGTQASRQTKLFDPLSQPQEAIVGWLRQHEALDFDRLSLLSGTPPGELAALLLELEFNQVVRALPGKRYMLA